MQIIYNNPFRVLGIKCNSSEREIQKQSSKLKAYLNTNKTFSSEFDFNFLEEIDRNLDLLVDSTNQIYRLESKVLYSIFWFSDIKNKTIFDGDLSDDDYINKVSLSYQEILHSDLTTTEYICIINNWSNFLLSVCGKEKSLNKELFQKGIALKGDLLKPENLNNYIAMIVGKTDTINQKDLLLSVTNELLSYYNCFIEGLGNYAIKGVLDCFSSFPEVCYNHVKSHYKNKGFQNIDHYIDLLEVEKSDFHAEIEDIALRFKECVKPEILSLKRNFNEEDIELQVYYDKVSNLIIDLGIQIFNDTGNDVDYKNEYEFAYNIAISERIKERASKCVKECEEFIEKNYKCWFCNEKMEDENKINFTLYKDTSNSFVYSYKYIDIGIPYCSACRGKHEFANGLLVVFIFLGALFGGGTFVLFLELYNTNVIVVSFLVLLMFVFLGLNRKKTYLKRKSIKIYSRKTLNEYPAVKERIQDGWTYKVPNQ